MRNLSLITYLVDIVLILQGEILSWSLMRVKGLKGGEYRKLTANERESFEYCRALRGDRVNFL